nr:immunoglobulin light chain junction region [Macaca mulatta]
CMQVLEFPPFIF